MEFPNHSSFAARGKANEAALKLFPAFYDLAHEAIASAYPGDWCKFGHHIAGNSLLTRSAISQLAGRLPAGSIDVRSGAQTAEADGGASAGAGSASTVRRALASIETNGLVVRLGAIDQSPRYDAFMREVLTELKPQITAKTGAMLLPEAYLTIASPHSKTALHFDPAYALEFQLSGSRSVMSFPGAEAAIIGDGNHADYRAGLPNYVAWSDEFAQAGQRHELAPGEALYVPVLAPHYVTVHEEVSASLTLTWRSAWSENHARACRFNARLQRRGAKPDPARLYPGRNWAKAYAERSCKAWDFASEQLAKRRAAKAQAS